MSFSLKPFAQEQAWSTLLALSEALPQGLILIGPAGVGKRRAARALFQRLNCLAGAAHSEDEASGSLFGAQAIPTAQEPAAKAASGPSDTNERAVGARSMLPCGECAQCRKIAEGKHPDFLEIKPVGEVIPVDELREMKKTLFFSPLEAKVRFVVIDQAHKLGAAAANTLLKTLEEPPTHTRFLLITHERGLLLPTITSRCQFVHFAPLDEDTLRELLRAQGLEIPERLMETCLKLMGGGLERATQLSDEKVLGFIDTTLRALRAAEQASASGARGPSMETLAQLADSLAAGAGGEGDWKLELLLDLLVVGGHDQALERAKAAPAGGNAGVQGAIWRAMQAAYLRRRLERYANRKLVALAAAELAAQS